GSVSKYDPSGHLLWTWSLGGALSVNDIVVDANGGVFVTGGGVAASFPFPSVNACDTQYPPFLAKLDAATGSLIHWTAMCTAYASSSKLARDSGGNMIVVGSIGSQGGILGATTVGLLGDRQLFVAKVSPAGGLTWTTELGAGTQNSFTVSGLVI